MILNIHKALLKKGYFPDELGFWFTTEGLSNKFEQIDNHISLSKGKVSKPVKYSIPKGRFSRRTLSIPNPYNYLLLCKEIDKNWVDIKEHLNKSSISLTTPIFKSGTSRAISRKYSFEEISSKFLTNSVGANYVLKTDISRYYSTIYTHSIPWALHTKEVAKINNSDNLLGNLLDKIIRNSQDRQTIGIPIGPDTSLIISEIIGVAIDEFITQDISALSVMRYIDDYYIFYEKMADAEKTLTNIQKVLGKFELELNKEKTNIYKMPQSIEPNWVSQINNLALSNDNIISFISTIYVLIKENPQHEVLRYALARLKKLKINKKNWPVIQSFILNSILYDPSGMPLAYSILSEYYHKRYGIDEDMVLKAVNNGIEKALVSNSDYEIVWLIWMVHLLKIKIKDDMLKKLCKIDNPIIALILLALYKHTGKLDTSLWESYMVSESLYNENWLLAYEALIHGWLPSKTGTDYIEEDEFFKILKRNNITFFDVNCRTKWINENIEEKWLPIFSPAF